jgi:hypothetical protein
MDASNNQCYNGLQVVVHPNQKNVYTRRGRSKGEEAHAHLHSSPRTRTGVLAQLQKWRFVQGHMHTSKKVRQLLNVGEFPML